MSWDKTWESVFKENEWGKYPAESLIRFVARNFYNKDRESVKILEVGCGPGANIWYMAREGFCVYGIDGSPTAIERAAKRMVQDNLKVDLKVGDIEKLPYLDSYFDAVVDNECLAHNPKVSAKSILKEISRVLKKEGILYSRTFTDSTYIGRSFTKLGNLGFNNISDGPFANRGFVRLTSRSSMKDIYSVAFKIISVDKIEYTNDNGKWKVSEWVIICSNR